MVGVATEICADSTAILTLVGLNLVNHPQEAANRARDSKKDRLAKVEVAEAAGAKAQPAALLGDSMIADPDE